MISFIQHSRKYKTTGTEIRSGDFVGKEIEYKGI